MRPVYISGNPESEEEMHRMLEEAFDEFMLKVPMEQRRFLRRFGYSEGEIDEVLQNPTMLAWEIRSPGGEVYSAEHPP